MVVHWKSMSFDMFTDLNLYMYGAWPRLLISLQWRHNGRHGVSNHQPRHCLLNCLFRRKSKKTPKLRVTGLFAGNSPVTGEFPHKWPVTRKMLPFYDVTMQHIQCWWCTNAFLIWFIIRSDNGLASNRRQAISWNNANSWSIRDYEDSNSWTRIKNVICKIVAILFRALYDNMHSTPRAASVYSHHGLILLVHVQLWVSNIPTKWHTRGTEHSLCK